MTPAYLANPVNLIRYYIMKHIKPDNRYRFIVAFKCPFNRG